MVLPDTVPEEIQIDIEKLIDKFKQFLTSSDKYIDEINSMIIQRRRSICIDFPDLIMFDKELADLLIERPREVIYAASEALRQIILEKDPEYAKTVKHFHARFRKLSETIPLRRLRSYLIGKLIMIEGIVTRQTPPKHFLKKVVYRCENCGFEVDVPQYYAVPSQPPKKCLRCGGVLKIVQEKCEFMDWQKIIVQEKPEELPPGQLPRSVEVILTDDLVDAVKPGDRVYVVGILDVNAYELKRTKPPVLSSYIEANYIEAQQKEFAEVEITPEDQRLIEELARDPNIRERIIKSIAPSIYGLEDVKEAIACLLFGGVPKQYPDGVRVRGDIHVLLIGDPGTGKSQLLRFVARIAPRAVYTTGKGSSAAGLCVGPDTIVHTDRGVVPIVQIVEDNLAKGEEKINENIVVAKNPNIAKVLAPSPTLDNVEIHNAVQYYRIKTNRVITLVTEDGREITLTPETKILIYNEGKFEWKKAGEIKPGDLLIQVRKIPETLKIQNSTELKDLSVENTLTLFELLGLAYFNSKLCENSTVHIFLKDSEVANYVTDILLKLFRLNEEMLQVHRVENGVNIVVKCENIATLFKKFDVGNYMSLSKLITSADLEHIKMFMKGLFKARGIIYEDKIVISLPSRIAAYQVSELLRYFGVFSVLRKSDAGDEYLVEIYGKDASMFCREILGENIGIVEAYSPPYVVVNDSYVAVKVLDVQEQFYDGYVYDFTINDVHSFVANGFIVHNTAAVVKDKLTGEFYLEAGALVLADMGVCIIDEIDKMDAKDRVAMHEALEQQTISIAKAGIVATLNARCAVLAAANPAFGRYLPNRTVAENVDLPVTLLSRFDLIFIIRDQPSIDHDKKVAEHVTTLHSGELPQEFKDIIPPDLLRKYIAYARKYVKPRWTKEARDLIMEFYINLRAKSTDPSSPIAITARQLEALIRLAEAEAKMRLSPLVEREDAERAIRLFEKFLKSVGIDIETGKIDIDIIMTGKPRSKQEKLAKLMDIIARLEEANGGRPVKLEDVYREAENAGLDRQTVDQLINILIKSGELYTPKQGYVKRVTM